MTLCQFLFFSKGSELSADATKSLSDDIKDIQDTN